MFIKQISVFIENKKGRLASLTDVLAKNGIDLIALSMADTADYGIMRAIVNDTDKAKEVLRAHNFAVTTTEVLAAEVPDRPGGLSEVLVSLQEQNISVEYLYSFVRSSNAKALILFKVNNGAAAAECLTGKGIRLLSQAEVNEL